MLKASEKDEMNVTMEVEQATMIICHMVYYDTVQVNSIAMSKNLMN